MLEIRMDSVGVQREESIMEVVKTTGHMILMQKLSKNKQILKMKNVIYTHTIL